MKGTDIMRVLVVDDSETIRRVIVNVLHEEFHFTIDEANDGDVALKKISENKYNLLILDLNMPTLSGESVLHALKNDNQKIPIIVCSKESEKEHIIETLKEGAIDYITKPFTKEILIEKVRKAIQKDEIILR